MDYYEDNMRLFWTYTLERYSVYHKKEVLDQPPPWTNDPIIANYKMTNIFRELDRGTRFVTNHIHQNKSLKPIDVIFNTVIYRLFNKIETFLHHDFQYTAKYDRESFEESVRVLDAEQCVWTSAFIVSGYGMAELQGMDKIERLGYIIEWLKDQLVYDEHLVDEILADTDMSVTYKKMLGLTGLGKFLAYQVAVDLSYWEETQFGEDDFVVMGPGAREGIDWLFPKQEKDEDGNWVGEDPRDGRNYEECCMWLREKQYEFFADYDLNYEKILMSRQHPYLTVMSLENQCCEFQKYMKAYEDSGRPRCKYNPEEGVQRQRSYRGTEPWNHGGFNVYSKPQNLANYERLINE